MKVAHMTQERLFSAQDDAGNTAGHLEYGIRSDDNTLLANAVYVDPAQRGKKVGELLVDAMVAYAREQQVGIVPVCPYVEKLFEKHPELYGDVATS